MKIKATCKTCGIEFITIEQKGYSANHCSKKCRYDYLVFSILGKKYNNLTIIREVQPKELRNKCGVEVIKMVECLCDCGELCVMSATRIKIGRTKSCGCLRDNSYKTNLKSGYKHGLFYHPLKAVWGGMIQRGTNPNCKAFPRYGGKGVKVCEEWLNSFLSFYNWAISNGWEKGLQLDKDIIAIEKGLEPLLYSPEMCQFVTRKANCNARVSTRYVELNGSKVALSIACDIVGLPLRLVYGRMQKNGFDFNKAIKNGKI